jgi:D-amino-acid dehydrogenase
MEVLIIGGGVIGLTTAYYLDRAGHRVTVVERNEGVALETSYANGGQLSYSYVAPLAGPGVLSKIPKWLMDRDGPMRFRPLLSSAQWKWCVDFALSCTRQQSDESTRELLALAFQSRGAMHDLIRDEPTLEFNYVQSGKLVFFRDQQTYRAAVDQLDYQRTLGCEQQALDREACVRIEPALDSIESQIVGGIYTPSEDTADCYRFCQGLERLLRGRGASFITGMKIDTLRHTPDGRISAFSGEHQLDVEHVVVANGCASTALLSPLGIRVPVYPLKGYSLTVPIHVGSTVPTLSVTDFARKVVYARLGNRLRIAGMADLTGYSLSLERDRLETLKREAQALFPNAGDFEGAEKWAGLRPATPRGTPIIGPTRFPNLWLNVGHGALGFTLATGSAKSLVDRMTGNRGSLQ